MRTPAAPVDPLALVPGLAPYARTATRLHPRPGDPSPDGSHIGGPIRWPAGEPWPICTADLPLEEEECVERLDGGFLAVTRLPGAGARPLPHLHPNPMIVVAQLRAADIPGLWHPPGAEMLQVLWCPFDHVQAHGYTPMIELFWRPEDPAMPVADPPLGLADERYFVPVPCVLHPERVVEYPDPDDLPPELSSRIEALGKQIDYVGELSTAPGWKVGGWPQWSVAGHAPTQCHHCGNPMTLLLTIDSAEHGGDRWEPVGDSSPKEPTGIVVGRWGALQIFLCTRCAGHPVRFNLQ